VHVAAWQHDGTARVPYRGATWSVRWAGTGAPVKGELVIVALNGNELRLGPGAPGSHQSTP
jgi:hypothetical protein